MAYSGDIDNLGADHHWSFNGNSTDSVGSVVATDFGMAYSGPPLTKDASASALMDERGDFISLATTTTINNDANTRKAVCGWFMVDAKQLPTCTIYTEGDRDNNFMIVIFPGNTVMLQLRDGATWQVQVYSDVALEGSRVYHLCAILEGSGFSDEVRFYIDGVEQTAGDPVDRAPGNATLSARGITYFGDTSSVTVGINGVILVMNGPGDDNLIFGTRNAGEGQVVNAYYQHWAAWGDEADAVLTETEVRETLFERGALSVKTVTGKANQDAAQSQIDTYADDVLPNETCSIEFDDLTTPADFTITLDNIIFDDLSSIHIRNNSDTYTLTVINTNGANCSIVSAPFGGSIELFTEVTVQITVKSASDLSAIVGAMVLLEADAGGDLSEGTDIIKTTTNGSGITSTDFNYSSNQPVRGVVRKGTSSTFFKSGSIVATITNEGLDLTILLVEDE